MKTDLFFLMLILLLLIPVSVVSGQTGASTVPQTNSQPQEERTEISVTGCLTKDSSNQYELVDQEGVHNLPESSSISLDQFVGQEVTLIGQRTPMPTKNSVAQPKARLAVSKVQVSGKCDIP